MASAATHGIGWKVSTSEAVSVEWGTPDAIYRALDQEFDFTLDAAASPANAKHVRYVLKDTDALRIPWTGHRVFCNPPYGRQLAAWMEKGRHEAEENGTTSVFLVPARTGTRWFHAIVLRHASEIRFIQGRLSYTLGAASRSGRAPFDSMVVVFRPGGRGDGRAQLLMPFLSRVR
jgi:site-specific DNA-methyltransferase (adenine-specific)